MQNVTKHPLLPSCQTGEKHQADVPKPKVQLHSPAYHFSTAHNTHHSYEPEEDFATYCTTLGTLLPDKKNGASCKHRKAGIPASRSQRWLRSICLRP